VRLPAHARPERLPAAESALADPPGLVAVGGALSEVWLVHAYRNGIFPWFAPGQPILWWSPDPRCVIEPANFRRHRSLVKAARNRGYVVSEDQAFAAVVAGCAAPRDADGGTWITAEMQAAYLALHRRGIAHSVEVWDGPALVGGLYGVRLGGMYFGESMYSRVPDASKIALMHLVDRAGEHGVELIDCQFPTAHLASLGATTLSRNDFLHRLRALVGPAPAPGA
jgi:leucyl/phenylalanyl-tRNA--protein transferase